jgi:alcohol dehydrogenase
MEWKTPVTYGWQLTEELGSYLPEGDCFLVLGGLSSDRLGLEGMAKSAVRGKLHVFKGVEPNPTERTVEGGAASLRASTAKFVLAMGGGSVMDAAKMMALMAGYGGSARDYLTGKRLPEGPGYPVFCVPTTPGTSSEITPYAVVTVPELSSKLSVRHPAIYPKAALIDPSLTLDLPLDQTTATGLDILAHAFESFWSRSSDPITRSFSMRSVQLVRKHLEGAWNEPSSRPHREGMSLAGIMAGMSFSQVGTSVCHAISYPITLDTGLPHGTACALTLGATFDRLREKGAKGLDEIAEAFGSSPGSFKDDLSALMHRLGAPSSISATGFKGGSERVLSTEMKGFLSNSCIPLDREDVLIILESSL